MVCCKFRGGRANHLKRISSCCGLIYKIFMRIIGPLVFIMANVLIFSVGAIFILVFFPEVAKKSYIEFVLHMAFSIYILTNIFFNYFACAFTYPGSPSYCPDPARYLGEKATIIDGRKVYQMRYQLFVDPYVSYTYCKHCKCIKPPRAHHCSVVGKCILNMDHYCPWMCTCIGYYNYRHFYLFLVNMFFGSLYVVLCLTFGIIDVSLKSRNYYTMELDTLFHVKTLHLGRISLISYSFTLALAATISVGILLFWHSYLCLTNQTSIEFYINMENYHEAKTHGGKYKNPYDEGWRKNLRRVFNFMHIYKNFLPNFQEPAPPKYPFELDDKDLKTLQNL